MMGNVAANLICPFLGTVAFAVLFNVPRKYYLAGGLTGTAGWLAYIFILNFSSAAIASFVGAFVVVFISRMLTVRMKCPITVYYLVTDQIALAGERGLGALKIAFAIVLGIAFVVSIPREVFRGQYWRNRKTEKMRTGEKQ